MLIGNSETFPQIAELGSGVCIAKSTLSDFKAPPNLGKTVQ